MTRRSSAGSARVDELELNYLYIPDDDLPGEFIPEGPNAWDAAEWNTHVANLDLPPTIREGRERTRFGCPRADRATTLLRRHGPYVAVDCADSPDGWEVAEALCYRVSEEEFVIYNGDLAPQMVSDAHLRDPEFNLPFWYQNTVCDELGCEMDTEFVGESFGNPTANRVSALLNIQLPVSNGVFVQDLRYGWTHVIPDELLELNAFDVPNYWASFLRRGLRPIPFWDWTCDKD